MCISGLRTMVENVRIKHFSKNKKVPLSRYKNGVEFYRYMPGQERKITVYDAPGVIIDVSFKTYFFRFFKTYVENGEKYVLKIF